MYGGDPISQTAFCVKVETRQIPNSKCKCQMHYVFVICLTLPPSGRFVCVCIQLIFPIRFGFHVPIGWHISKNHIEVLHSRKIRLGSIPLANANSHNERNDTW